MSERPVVLDGDLTVDTIDHLVRYLREQDQTPEQQALLRLRDLERMGLADVRTMQKTVRGQANETFRIAQITGTTEKGTDIALLTLMEGERTSLVTGLQQILQNIEGQKNFGKIDTHPAQSAEPEEEHLTLLALVPLPATDSPYRNSKGESLRLQLQPAENSDYYPQGKGIYYGEQRDRILYQLHQKGIDIVNQNINVRSYEVLNPYRRGIRRRDPNTEPTILKTREKIADLAEKCQLIGFHTYEPENETKWKLTVVTVHRTKKPTDEERTDRVSMLRRESLRQLLHKNLLIRKCKHVVIDELKPSHMQHYTDLAVPCWPDGPAVEGDDPEVAQQIRHITAITQDFSKVRIHMKKQHAYEVILSIYVPKKEWKDAKHPSEYSGKFKEDTSSAESLNDSLKESLQEDEQEERVSNAMRESQREDRLELAANMARVFEEKFATLLGRSERRQIEFGGTEPDATMFTPLDPSEGAYELPVQFFNGSNFSPALFDDQICQELLAKWTGFLQQYPGLYIECMSIKKGQALKLIVHRKHG